MSTQGLLGSQRPLAEEYDLALVDLDGVVYAGHLPVPYASASLVAARERGMSLVFVTNNASREPGAVAEQLTTLGVPTTAHEVYTSAQAGAALLRTRLEPGATVLVIGGDGLRTAVREQGFVLVDGADDAPDAVVQGYAADLGWADLAEAAYAVEGGAWFVATNLDLSLPTARGYAPGNGALVGAVTAATGVRPASAGKPDPQMYRWAVERVGGSRPLVVGDRLDTDLAGARGAGYPGLHVLTGVSRARAAVLASPGERPSFLGADLRALHVVHRAPQQRDGGWFVLEPAGAEPGGAARVTGGRLEVADGAGSAGALDAAGAPELALDLVRCLCAAAWDAADRGEPVDPAAVPEAVISPEG